MAFVYSDVVKNGWILPKKKLYTVRDVDRVLTDSLFSKRGKTLTVKEAVFIVKASALYHDTDYSKGVSKAR